MLHPEYAQQAALHGLGGVVDEVSQGAADGLGIGQHRRQARLQVAIDGNAFETTGEERQRLVGHLVHIAGSRLGRGKLRQRRELVDQGAQRANAAQDHFTALANHVGRIRLDAVEMFADALGGERDGRERILDLVRHALRHFLPCQLALGAKQIRRVFNHQHRSRLAAAPGQAGRW